jgi:hypothetical protein
VARLARSPLVSDFRTTAVARDGAVVTFAYLGDPQRLQNDLLQRGVALGDEPRAGWVLRSAFLLQEFREQAASLIDRTTRPDELRLSGGPLRFGQLVVTPANQATVSIIRQPFKWPTPVFCVTGPTLRFDYVVAAWCEETGGVYFDANRLYETEIRSAGRTRREIRCGRQRRQGCSERKVAHPHQSGF